MMRPALLPISVTWRRDIAIGVGVLAGLSLIFYLATPFLHPFHNFMVGILLMLGIFVIKFCFEQDKKPFRLGLCFIAATFAGCVLADIRGKTALEERNFYGIVTIDRSDPEVFMMRHGTTIHGVQYNSGEKHLVPLTYYHPSGPLGDLMKPLLLQPAPLNIAAIGLGVGSIACYGRKNDSISFFEINPAVINMANDTNYFSYLHDCAPSVKVIAGDGRINIEHSKEQFDLLVLDAFTSDAIPIHLLTKEAFTSYRKHLKDNGLILVHISNRYLDLARVLRAIAHEGNMEVKIFADKDSAQERYKQVSTWAVMGKTENISKLNLPERWDNIGSSGAESLWTDDYSNILYLLY